MLLARPVQKKQECVLSYLIRVSNVNGFRHVGKLLGGAGLNWKNSRIPTHNILSGEYDLGVCLQNLGLPVVTISSAQVYQTFSRIVDTSHVFVKSPRICPECIREKGYCSKDWVYLPIVGCLKHGRLLVDIDGRTGKKLSWYRSSLIDQEFRSISRDATELELALTSYFLMLLGSCRSESVYVPEVLLDLELSESLTLINFLAHYLVRLRGTRFKPASMKVDALAQEYASVWAILENWPSAFYDMLDQYIDSPMSERGIGGVNKHFRDLTEAMHRQRKNKGIQRLRVEFDVYIEERWPGYINLEKASRINVDPDSRDTITKSAAASLLNCRPVRIDKYVRQKKLVINEFKGKKYYSRAEVSALAELISSNWSMRQVSEEMCLSPYQLRQLLEAGVIPVIQRPDRLNRDWIIDKQKCRAFIHGLLGNAQKRLSKSAVSLSGIQKNGFPIVRLVEAMRVGSVQYRVQLDKKRPSSFKQFVEFQVNGQK